MLPDVPQPLSATVVIGIVGGIIAKEISSIAKSLPLPPKPLLPITKSISEAVATKEKPYCCQESGSTVLVNSPVLYVPNGN